MLKKLRFYFHFPILILFFVFLFQDGLTSQAPLRKEQVKYRTHFGSCPSRAVGTLALKLIKVFEKKQSLREVKKVIVEEKLKEKHFLGSYKVNYSPLKKYLEFKFDCPKPLMKVQIYKKNGLDSYEAILVENGQLFDPTYEVLLRAEKKLKRELPFLALPVGDLDKDVQADITELIKDMGSKFRRKLSEVILDEKGELTVILSLQGNPSSVFLGDKKWLSKAKKLKRIVSYMEKKRRIPAIINLTNSDKVVVKFNGKF